MALKINYELNNGIVLNYHRINNLNIITNNKNIIEITSYISEAQRLKEIEYYGVMDEWFKNGCVGESPIMNVFTHTSFVETNYDQSMNIDGAYEFLKLLEEFKDAEDV